MKNKFIIIGASVFGCIIFLSALAMSQKDMGTELKNRDDFITKYQEDTRKMQCIYLSDLYASCMRSNKDACAKMNDQEQQYADSHSADWQQDCMAKAQSPNPAFFGDEGQLPK